MHVMTVPRSNKYTIMTTYNLTSTLCHLSKEFALTIIQTANRVAIDQLATIFHQHTKDPSPGLLSLPKAGNALACSPPSTAYKISDGGRAPNIFDRSTAPTITNDYE